MTTPRLLLGLCVLLGILVLVMWFIGSVSRDTQALAHQMVVKCREESDHAKCYEREVPALFPKLSISRLFGLVREIRKEDPTYQFCHVLGHKLGERVVAEDPKDWVDAIQLNPADGMCSNGFIHGVIGGRFRAEVLDDATLESLIPDFTRACAPRPSWKPSDLDRAICYHGMGHLYDFITDANIGKALDVCGRTVPPDFRRVCTEGVFMQIYQPLEPDDFLMIERMPVKPSTTTVRQFCSRFHEDEYEGACLRESWPYFRQGILDGTGAGAFCSGQPNVEEEKRCYESISSIVGRMSLGEPQKAAATCGDFPSDFQDMCYSASAQAVLEENRTESRKALDLCAGAPETIAHACAAALVDHARFIYGEGSAEYARFCSMVPTDLRPRCDSIK